MSVRAWRYQCDGFNTTCTLPDLREPPVIDLPNRGCYYDAEAEVWCAQTEGVVWLPESSLNNQYCGPW